MRGKYQVSTFGGLGGLFHKDDATLGQGFNDEAVVHDLLAHVDGSAVLFQCLFHCLNSAIHAGAVAAGSREEHLLCSFSHANQSI